MRIKLDKRIPFFKKNKDNMNREEFAKRLERIQIQEGTDPRILYESVLPLCDALMQMMPQSLFRYRSCNEKQIEAFLKDAIYAVSADLFNDPYDTLVRYDIKSIKNYVDALLESKALIQLQKFLEQGNDFTGFEKNLLPNGVVEKIKEQILATDFEEKKDSLAAYKRQMMQMLDFSYPLLAEASKRFVSIACFCESVKSITMWSHYADYHKGFALEYKMRPTLTKGIKEGVGLYPVIYDDMRYDASQYMAWAFLKMLGVNGCNPDVLSHTKCVLHKSKQWEYEKEWRLVDYSTRNYLVENITSINYKPTAIYYGVRIANENKEQLHEIAKAKGIAEFDMYIDYSSPKYEMMYKSHESSTD